MILVVLVGPAIRVVIWAVVVAGPWPIRVLGLYRHGLTTKAPTADDAKILHDSIYILYTITTTLIPTVLVYEVMQDFYHQQHQLSPSLSPSSDIKLLLQPCRGSTRSPRPEFRSPGKGPAHPIFGHKLKGDQEAQRGTRWGDPRDSYASILYRGGHPRLLGSFCRGLGGNRGM